jgi:hypothetical protein
MIGLSACEDKKTMTQNTSTESTTKTDFSPTIGITVGKTVHEFYEEAKHNCLVYNKKVMSRAIKNDQIQFAVEQRKEGVWLIDYREKIEGKTTYSHYSGKEYKIDYDGKQIKGTAVMESHGKKDVSLSFYIQCS